nr:MAG TPA: hypothetical protein [Caudoviricetes sp.]
MRELKANNRLEQKILEVLREEIGVDIGEEFKVYKNDIEQLTCKFEEEGFFCNINFEFQKTRFWKDILCDIFDKIYCYKVKTKSFIPKKGEDYFSFSIESEDGEDMLFDVISSKWGGSSIDFGRLALGNVFKSKREALESKGKLKERLCRVMEGEWV